MKISPTLLLLFFTISLAAQHKVEQNDDLKFKEVVEFMLPQKNGQFIFERTLAALNDVREANISNVLTLEINPNLKVNSAKKAFSIELEFEVHYGDSETNLVSETAMLKVGYAPDQPYKAKDAFLKEAYRVVKYKLKGVIYTEDSSGKAIDLLSNDGTQLSPLFDVTKEDLITLHHQTQYDRYVKPNIGQIAGNLKLIKNSGYVKCSWDEVPWAMAYEVEYTFADNYGTRTGTVLLPHLVQYDFKGNSTRIETLTTEIEIPLVYESGYLLFRVRPLSYWGKNLDKRVYGLWTNTNDTGVVNLKSDFNLPDGCLLIEPKDIHELDKKNWQHVTSFAEGAKRKDAVSYLDGTLRQRQIVSNLTSQKSVIVSETIYDFVGRPVIEMLPAPVLPSTTYPDKQPLKFYKAFNQNKKGNPYKRWDFDLDPKVGLPMTAQLGDQEGAGKYYSPNNGFDLKGSAMLAQLAFIPYGKGYPFTQIEYMADNTGRIRRRSLPGDKYHFDISRTNKFSRYYYGTPSQEELDRMFGNDVGYAKHYDKEVRIDENGQAYVSYKDLKGNVIATALTGVPPPNVTALEGISEKSLTINLIDEQNRVDKLSNRIVSEYTLTITQPTNLKLDYTLASEPFTVTTCDAQVNLCYDCIYDLEIQVKDEFGNVVKDTNNKEAWWTKTIGTISDKEIRTENKQNVAITNSNIRLEIGSYKVTKILSVNRESINKYVADYIGDENIWTCKYPIEVPSTPTIQCIDIEKKEKKPCEIQRSLMMVDMSPAGQYETISQSNFKEAFEKRKSIIVNISGVIRPAHLLSWQELSIYWTDEMAEAMLAYHPEKCYLDWCQQNSALITYSDDVMLTEKAADARTETSYKEITEGNPDSKDVLFNLPNSSNAMAAFMKQPFSNNTTWTILDYAKIAAAGFSNEINEAEINSYLVNRALFDNPTELADSEWRQLKMLYLNKRTELLDKKREADISTKGCKIKASAIKIPVFPTQAKVEEIIKWKNPGDPKPESVCGNCYTASGILQFLNSRLEGKSKLTDPAPIFGSNLSLISSPRTDLFLAKGRKFEWAAKKTNSELKGWISVVGDASPLCTINLKVLTPNAQFDWDKIIGFTCLKTGNSTTDFSLMAQYGDGQQYELTGQSTCLNMKACYSELMENGCKQYEEPIKEVTEALMKYIFIAKQPVIRVGQYGDGNKIKWCIDRPIDIKNGSFTFDFRRQCDSNCSISIKSSKEVLLSIDQWIIKEINLQPQVISATSSPINTIVIVLKRKGGKASEATIEVTSKCFDFGSCQFSLCCYPLMKEPIVEKPLTCDQIADIQKANNIEILSDASRKLSEDNLRNAYITHCLQPIEKFTVKYKESTYQYTLSYFDPAGNLIKTIPPRGVKLLTDDQIKSVTLYRKDRKQKPIFPEHTMATTYAYNTLNSVIKTITPDAGEARLCYDELGRLIYTQKVGRTSFIFYDKLGRVAETGQIPSSYFLLPFHLKYIDFKKQLAINHPYKTDVFTTFYDTEPVRVTGGFDKQPSTLGLNNLRNRVSAVVYHSTFLYSSPYVHAFFYDYDINGNVKKLVQDFRHLAKYDKKLNLSAADLDFHRFKTIEYDYDLISRKVNRVWYQPNQTDQFIHWYQYDADNRITSVKTSNRIWEDTRTIDKDAQYEYYLHGPLARIELGREKVQGLDYAYTIQGWQKGMNSTLLEPGLDIGRDGSGQSTTLKDAIAYTLNYYEGDYSPVGGKDAVFTPDMSNTHFFKNTNVSSDLFNGNIRSMITSIDKFSGADKIQGTAYRYDALNRLKEMQTFRATDYMHFESNGGYTDLYKTAYRYDPNGNILALTRNNELGKPMDDLAYSYYNINNQLNEVKDQVGRVSGNDLDSTNTFQYDFYGRLGIVTEGPAQPMTQTYTWNNFDKLRNVKKDDGTNIEFEYNSNQHRAFKFDEKTNTGTYYVNDLQGNPMAIYTLTDKDIKIDINIYGSNRLGSLTQIIKPISYIKLDTASLYRGEKQYELTNHLGNVLVTISDRKRKENNIWVTDVVTASDYYPGGSLMPARIISSNSYRYGYNKGSEKDDEISGAGNHFTTIFREGDTRLLIWWSPDPKIKMKSSRSPYSFMDGNPVLLNDPNGDCPPGTPCADVVKSPIISSDNGGKNNNRFRMGKRDHEGLDVLASKGTEALNILAGKVVDVFNNHDSDEYSGRRRVDENGNRVSKTPTTGYGNSIVIKHNLESNYSFISAGKEVTLSKGTYIYIRYSHLDHADESLLNKDVGAGLKIGVTGATGNPGFYQNQWGISADNRHVHIEVSTSRYFSRESRIDPEAFMNTKYDKQGYEIPNPRPNYFTPKK